MSARKRTVQTGAQIAAENRVREAAEAAARDRKHYGDALQAVLVLRQNGYAIHYDRGQIHVDDATRTRDEIKAMAARYGAASDTGVRRPKVAANGLKIGEVVQLRPKVAATSTPGARHALLSTAKTGLGTRPVEPPAPRKLSGAAAVTAAKAHEASADPGPRPRLEWIAVDKLAIDRRYQREVNQQGRAHIVRIRRNFSWTHYQPIVVTATGDGGMFYVIDGQHRLEAARLHPLVDDLPCYVVDAATVAAQAAIFVSANSARIAVLRIHKFWAAHAAGEKTARTIDALCRDAGVTIARGPVPRPVPPLTTIATFTLEKLLPGGKDSLGTALRILATAQPKAADVFRSATIVALTRIVGTEPALKEPRAVKTIAALDLSAELGRAQVERAQGGGKIEQAMEKILRRHLGLEVKAA